MKTAIRLGILIPGAVLFLYSCIGGDFVEDFVMPRVEVANPIDSLKVNDSYQFESRYFNNIGVVDSTVAVIWQSLTPTLITITAEGLATANAVGLAKVVLSSLTNPETFDTINVITNEVNTSIPTMPTERLGAIMTTSNYLLEGDLQLVEENGEFILKLNNNFMATSALPGLVIYLTNNPATNSGALEIAPITQFTGAQEFSIPQLTDINQYDFVLFYCKPFAVKVGDSELQ